MHASSAASCAGLNEAEASAVKVPCPCRYDSLPARTPLDRRERVRVVGTPQGT
jgi:hypothetical protein